MHPHDRRTRYSHNRYVSCNSSSSVPVLVAILQSVTVFLILAAACCFSKFAPDRDSRVLVALSRCLPPNMVTAYFAPVLFYFILFSQVLFFPNQSESPMKFYETCIQAAAALQRRDNIGCLLYTSPSPRDRQKSRMPSSA